MDRIKTYDDLDTLCEGFTGFLKNKIGEKAFSISLSGGSTPKAIFDFWATNYKKALPWNKIKLFWGDERCVPPEHQDSNYGMTKKHLLDHVDIPESQVFRIKGENDPGEEVKRYSQVLMENVPLFEHIPQFDLMILGLGDDGHTASIFPHEMELWDSPRNCVQANHPQNHQKRISLTGRVINNAKHVVFLVTGKKKSSIVRDIALRKKIFMDKFPAARVDPISEQLTWFLDAEAAKQL